MCLRRATRPANHNIAVEQIDQLSSEAPAEGPDLIREPIGPQNRGLSGAGELFELVDGERVEDLAVLEVRASIQQRTQQHRCRRLRDRKDRAAPREGRPWVGVGLAGDRVPYTHAHNLPVLKGLAPILQRHVVVAR